MGFVRSFETCWRELDAFVFLCLNEFSNAKIRTENLRKSFVCSSAVEILGIKKVPNIHDHPRLYDRMVRDLQKTDHQQSKQRPYVVRRETLK